jgi:hypothetical protein
MGFFKDLITNPIGTLSDTATKVAQNPAGAADDFWKTGGGDAAKAAAIAAAIYYGGPAAMQYFSGAGAGAGAAGAGAADLAAYDAIAGLTAGGAGAGAGAVGAGAAGVNALTGAGMGSSWMMPAAILGSSLYGANAAQQAGSAQAAAASRAADLQYQQFRDIAALQEPFRQAGVRALPQLEAQRNMMPAAFTGKVDLTQDPGYAFRLSEGQKALDRSAAARGGLISGGALKAAQRFGQDLGSQEYQNAYNRALTGYNADVAREATGYNRLAALAGYGQTATGQIGAAGQNMASNVGNLMTSGAAAGAAGQVGGANALTGGLGSYLNYAGQQDMLAAYNDRTRRSTYTG